MDVKDVKDAKDVKDEMGGIGRRDGCFLFLLVVGGCLGWVLIGTGKRTART